MDKELKKRLKEFFKVGNIVSGYRGPDLVLGLEISDDLVGGWEVSVRNIDKRGHLGRLRNHTTTPNGRWENKVLFSNT